MSRAVGLMPATYGRGFGVSTPLYASWTVSLAVPPLPPRRMYWMVLPVPSLNALVNVKKTPVAVAVALAEMVMVVALVMAVIVAPAGIPAPLTNMPTARLAVDWKPATELLPLVVLPASVSLALTR